MISLHEYLKKIQSGWDKKSEKMVADYLSLKDAHMASSKLHIENPDEIGVIRDVGRPLNELVSHHIRCLWSLSKGDFTDALQAQQLLVQTMCKVLQLPTQKEENWLLPSLLVICQDLRRLALAVDKSELLGKKSFERKQGENQEKAAEYLMNAFRICTSDNRSSIETTKRKGMLGLVNLLFRIYFNTSRLSLCKPLIRAIDSSNLKDQFSKAQTVTYQYYIGRKALCDSDFTAANEHLSYAFLHCHKDSKRNKRQILIYLIPVKMLLGYLPKRSLLEKYDLLQFSDVVNPLKQGDVRSLTKALKRNERFFLDCRINLILEKLRVLAYRNLFKKVCLITKNHQVPIEAFLVALQLMELPDIDLDETECLITNLIYEDKIKGYISYAHRKLVISKIDPFPLLSSKIKQK